MSSNAEGRIAGLRKFAARNRMGALVGSNVAVNLVRVASNLILTRLLAPDAFGAIGVIAAVQFFFVMLTDLGFNAFVIRAAEGDDKRFLNVVWTLRLVRNAGLSALMLLLSGPLANAFGKPEMQSGVAAASLILLIDGLRSMSFISAERHRRVSYLSAVEFAAFVVQTLVAIGAAAVLRSYWAIVIAMYANSAVSVIFSYTLFSHSAQTLAFDRKILRDVWDFGKIIMPSSAITLILTQADRVVIARYLPLEIFGLYMLAVSLTGAARQLIQSWGGRMLYPYFAEAGRRSPPAIAEVFYLSRRKLSLLMALALGGAIGGGSLIARVLFDERYLMSGHYISLLAIGPLLTLISIPTEMAMVAAGRVRMALQGNIARLIWIVIAAPLGYRFGGLDGLILAFALTELAAAVFWFWRLRQHRMLRWSEEALIIATAAVGVAGGLAAQWAATYAVARGILPAF